MTARRARRVPAPAVTGWVDTRGVIVPGVLTFALTDGRRPCPSTHRADGLTWGCTRLPHGTGRHMATAGGTLVYAAWPGEHAPTAADLEAVAV